MANIFYTEEEFLSEEEEDYPEFMDNVAKDIYLRSNMANMSNKEEEFLSKKELDYLEIIDNGVQVAELFSKTHKGNITMPEESFKDVQTMIKDRDVRTILSVNLELDADYLKKMINEIFEFEDFSKALIMIKMDNSNLVNAEKYIIMYVWIHTVFLKDDSSDVKVVASIHNNKEEIYEYYKAVTGKTLVSIFCADHITGRLNEWIDTREMASNSNNFISNVLLMKQTFYEKYRHQLN